MSFFSFFGTGDPGTVLFCFVSVVLVVVVVVVVVQFQFFLFHFPTDAAPHFQFFKNYPLYLGFIAGREPVILGRP